MSTPKKGFPLTFLESRVVQALFPKQLIVAIIVGFSRLINIDRSTRKLLDRLLPLDPLNSASDLPNLELLIVAHPRDFDQLGLTIAGAISASKNKINRVVLVVPDGFETALPRLPFDLSTVCESTLLSGSLSDAVRSSSPSERNGWMIQQVIKLNFVRQSAANGVLVVDADTALLKPRTFLDARGSQLLNISFDYRFEYERHALGVWGRRKRLNGISFVTHYQLMQPAVLREMFPDETSLSDWVTSADSTNKSPVSEYHSYGRFLCDRHWGKVSLAKWSNKSLSREKVSMAEQDTGELATEFPLSASISFHSYNDARVGKASSGENV